MRRLLDIIDHLSYSVALGAAVLLSACSGNDATETEDPLPDGMGRLQVTVTTRAVNEYDPNDSNHPQAVHEFPWENPDHLWEVMHSLRVIICKASDNTVVQIKEVTVNNTSVPTPSPGYTGETNYFYSSPVEVTSDPLPVGNYHIFATANYDDGYEVGEQIDLERTERFLFGLSKESDFTTAQYEALTKAEKDAIPFGYWRNIPMTGKLIDNNGIKSVGVTASSTPTEAGTLTVWRVISKMQFEFTNEATEQIKIYGIEVEPINTNASNQGLVYLFSKDDLTSTANLEVGGVSLPSGVTNGKVKHPLTTPTNPLLTLANYTGSGDKPTGTLFFYVNETNGTFTTSQNEISLRFKVKRGDGTEDELRYGMTSRWGSGDDDPKGFNVIRRNDWIHIPIVITDWQYRIEPIAFVPIAGYPAATVSSDGLTATYSTGGMIALQPFIKKKGDVTWVDLGDTRIKDVTISWVNADGDTQSGSGKIFTTPIDYDPHTNYIIGELNNSLDISSYTDNNLTVYTENGYKYFKTTVNIKMKLEGPEDPDTHKVLWYDYSFKCNIILKCETT